MSLSLLAALPVFSAGATEIYKWVDDNGVVHYADERPASERSVTTVEIAVAAERYDPEQDPYSILNQAKRIHQTWLELEALRLERALARQANASSQQSREADRERRYGYDRYVPYYPVVSRRVPARTAERQLAALEQLELTGPRPHSINSRGHDARVARSELLPLFSPGD
ncbi:MAG: DUF4124 domain-containing protein [Gammaproteobacteria bacterium]|nr:DUF4124 domain-containing protein [Gammaproteobacteria bacterium]